MRPNHLEIERFDSVEHYTQIKTGTRSKIPGIRFDPNCGHYGFNDNRPSEALDGKTPNEVYYDLPPACLAPRFEPRRKWPRNSPCAAPRTGIRGRRGTRLELTVRYLRGRKHLPIVELKRAA